MESATGSSHFYEPIWNLFVTETTVYNSCTLSSKILRHTFISSILKVEIPVLLMNSFENVGSTLRKYILNYAFNNLFLNTIFINLQSMCLKMCL